MTSHSRCEDWPYCGHGGDCPDHDCSGGEIWYCVGCGCKLSKDAPSSLCNNCQQAIEEKIRDTDLDYDCSMNY